MIGIALGNKPRGVKVYRKKFRVPFPLFADPDFSIYEQLGKPKTPTTIVVANGNVLSAHVGTIEDINEYLHQLRKFRQQE